LSSSHSLAREKCISYILLDNYEQAYASIDNRTIVHQHRIKRETLIKESNRSLHFIDLSKPWLNFIIFSTGVACACAPIFIRLAILFAQTYINPNSERLEQHVKKEWGKQTKS
jgi:hypothetical protein